jgi:ferredoxin-NADP reductase
MRARVAEKREVAKGTLMVVFDLLGEEVDFQAGQYFFVNLIDPPYDDDRGGRRHFSVVTSPGERDVLGFCTRLRDTAFKKSIQELEVGSEVDVEPPKGNYLLPEDTSRDYVFIAGGIGITVFRCMLRYIDENDLPYRVTLLHSNRTVEEAPFLDELRELEASRDSFRLVPTITDDPSWEGESRRIDADFLRDYFGDQVADLTYLVAGPPQMVTGMTETLADAGVPDDQVLPDKFSGY